MDSHDFQSLGGRHVVVLGGAGFLGSHVCDRLVALGARVTAVDNLLTGSAANLCHLFGTPGFRLRRHDIAGGPVHVDGEVYAVLHLASPASPVDYHRWPIETLMVGADGTRHALEVARAKDARMLLASTSEVYGDPLVHPQPESYRGNVDPVGPRSMYDEAKRFAEALTLAYHRRHNVSVRVARLFNVYGPRMRADDGRAVPTFVRQALADEPLTVHGEGGQTRSLCYVDDMVDGLLRLLLADVTGPVNLGNPHEVTMLALAEAVQDAAGCWPGVRHLPKVPDDPARRRPDTALAERVLGWSAKVDLVDGLARTVAWFRDCHTPYPAPAAVAASAASTSVRSVSGPTATRGTWNG